MKDRLISADLSDRYMAPAMQAIMACLFSFGFHDTNDTRTLSEEVVTAEFDQNKKYLLGVRNRLLPLLNLRNQSRSDDLDLNAAVKMANMVLKHQLGYKIKSNCRRVGREKKRAYTYTIDRKPYRNAEGKSTGFGELGAPRLLAYSGPAADESLKELQIPVEMPILSTDQIHTILEYFLASWTRPVQKKPTTTVSQIAEKPLKTVGFTLDDLY